ncbi:hypothetical protein KY316_00715, partial [Candidatus Woesearchaeota archaeon]|nr:hypothetical protein [Candidatus Woesearchaeota archaeon]
PGNFNRLRIWGKQYALDNRDESEEFCEYDGYLWGNVDDNILSWDDNCCGDDVPDDEEMIETYEFFCEGDPFNTVDSGCHMGRFTGDESKRAFGVELVHQKAGKNFGCCGDDYGDEGLIFTDVAGESFVCDQIDTEMAWRGIQHQYMNGFESITPYNNVGAIYHINTSVGMLQPENVNGSVNELYDVVGTEQRKWLVCDADSSLSYLEFPIGTSLVNASLFYAPDGVFRTPCVDGSDVDCQQIGLNDYMCYPDGRNESIFECVYQQTSLSLDERQGDYVGKIVPEVFSPTLEEFNRVNEPGCNAQFCTRLLQGGELSTTRPPSRLSNWLHYDYFTFNIWFDDPENLNNLDISIDTFGPIWSATLSDYMIGLPKNGWYRVMIPLDDHELLNRMMLMVRSISIKATADVGLVKFSDFSLYGGARSMYCGRKDGNEEAEWRSDLDTDTTSNGLACNAQKTTDWTGNYCCGDDYTLTNDELGYNSEFYRDADANCWDGLKVGNDGQLVNISNRRPILSFEDKFYGCFATELFDIKDTLTGEQIVDGTDVCGSFGSYYCSNFAQGWSSLGYLADGVFVAPANRTELVVDPYELTADCCAPGDCWNGTTCLANQAGKTNVLPYGFQQTSAITPETSANYSGFRCINGEWENSTIKWDWFDQNWGYCPDDQECLINRTTCVASGWYSTNPNFGGRDTSDIYCRNGTWITRTRMLAQTMLDIEDNNFVLDCGPYQKVINAWWASQFRPTNSFENIASDVELNNLCILSYGNNVVVGTTFNADAGQQLTNVLANAFGLLNKNVAGCSIDDGEFHSCGSGLWWNQRLQALIYDKKNNIDLDGNIFSQMYNFLLHWVYDLFDIELPISVGERTVEFLARA